MVQPAQQPKLIVENSPRVTELSPEKMKQLQKRRQQAVEAVDALLKEGQQKLDRGDLEGAWSSFTSASTEQMNQELAIRKEFGLSYDGLDKKTDQDLFKRITKFGAKVKKEIDKKNPEVSSYQNNGPALPKKFQAHIQSSIKSAVDGPGETIKVSELAGSPAILSEGPNEAGVVNVGPGVQVTQSAQAGDVSPVSPSAIENEQNGFASEGPLYQLVNSRVNYEGHPDELKEFFIKYHHGQEGNLDEALAYLKEQDTDLADFGLELDTANLPQDAKTQAAFIHTVSLIQDAIKAAETGNQAAYIEAVDRLEGQAQRGVPVRADVMAPLVGARDELLASSEDPLAVPGQGVATTASMVSQPNEMKDQAYVFLTGPISEIIKSRVNFEDNPDQLKEFFIKYHDGQKGNLKDAFDYLKNEEAELTDFGLDLDPSNLPKEAATQAEYIHTAKGIQRALSAAETGDRAEFVSAVNLVEGQVKRGVPVNGKVLSALLGTRSEILSSSDPMAVPAQGVATTASMALPPEGAKVTSGTDEGLRSRPVEQATVQIKDAGVIDYSVISQTVSKAFLDLERGEVKRATSSLQSLGVSLSSEVIQGLKGNHDKAMKMAVQINDYFAALDLIDKNIHSNYQKEQFNRHLNAAKNGSGSGYNIGRNHLNKEGVVISDRYENKLQVAYQKAQAQSFV